MYAFESLILQSLRKLHKLLCTLELQNDRQQSKLTTVGSEPERYWYLVAAHGRVIKWTLLSKKPDFIIDVDPIWDHEKITRNTV